MRALDRAPFREYDANVTRPEDAARRRRTQLPVLLLDQGLATLPTSCRRAVGRTSMTTENSPAPDTIVLVPGLWVTPRSWEHWIEHYEGRGYRVLAPAYPGLEVEVEALNEDPSPIEALTIPGVVEHLENIVGELENPPDHHGPLLRRRVHSDPARPRLRRGGGSYRLRAIRGRQGNPGLTDQIPLSHIE